MAVLMIMDEAKARKRRHNHPQIGTVEISTPDCPFCGKATRIVCDNTDA